LFEKCFEVEHTVMSSKCIPSNYHCNLCYGPDCTGAACDKFIVLKWIVACAAGFVAAFLLY